LDEQQSLFEALARNTKNDRFAWDAYRRFVQMYSSVVIGLPKEELKKNCAP